MPSQSTIAARLAVLFFAIFSLVISGLSSASARFAVVLRDQARLDYINTPDIILNTNFQSLQNNILIAEIISALSTATLAISGAAIVLHPRLLREKDAILSVFGRFQFTVALVIVVTGGYIADHVYGFQTSFAKFGANDSTRYYGIIYYGNVAQAAYGSVLLLSSIAFMLI